MELQQQQQQQRANQKPPPYRVVIKEAVTSSYNQNPDQDPYLDVWGPSPYACTPNSRTQIAHDHQHRNSLPAKSDIVARGASLELLIRFLQCSHAQLEELERQTQQPSERTSSFTPVVGKQQ